MTHRANINHNVLKWARIDAGYDDSNLPLAIKKNYRKWESGELKPSWNQLRDLANQYKRPSAFFFRTEPPVKEEVDLIEYRQTEHISKKSPRLIYSIRNYKNLRDIYLELLERKHLKKKSFKQYKFDSTSPEEFASKIRDIIGVDLKEQKRWLFDEKGSKDLKHYRFLNKWKESLNNLGILVFESERVSSDEMKGLTLYYDEYPIIILNGSDYVNSRIFSLFHELTHLMLGESAICDLEEENNKEIFCNAVAGEFLVPSYDLLKKKEFKNHDPLLNYDDILELSNEYGVSREVILRRILNIGKIDKESYNNKVKKLNIEYKDSGSGGNFLNNKVKYYGKMYSRLVLSTYESGIISATEFSEFMGLKINHIPKLEDMIFGD
ncbi:MAG: ImmA/IrrE family metallo-endopeptidase [Methanobrevibacter sp.]|jgi:Zn-dependent peptidase ImmA (M78 family)|nr:ImmA/IrrE family metallo-endopeptidase [Candidatus Methanovirga australis]